MYLIYLEDICVTLWIQRLYFEMHCMSSKSLVSSTQLEAEYKEKVVKIAVHLCL